MDEAYLLATRNAIRTEFGLDEFHCDVTPDGKAAPISGQWYYAVHPGEMTNSAKNCLDERVGLRVTITIRTGVAPVDRVGQNAVTPSTGILARAKRLRALLHMNYAVMEAANALISGEGVTVSGFSEPMRFLSATYLGPKGPSWFFADGQDEYTGLAVELRFGDARRVQYIESQT